MLQLEYELARLFSLRVGHGVAQLDISDLTAARLALGAHGHQGTHPAFVSRAPRFDSLPDPHFLFSELLVEPLLFGRLARELLLFAALIRGVVAGPGGQAPP